MDGWATLCVSEGGAFVPSSGQIFDSDQRHGVDSLPILFIERDGQIWLDSAGERCELGKRVQLIDKEGMCEVHLAVDRSRSMLNLRRADHEMGADPETS